MNDGVEALRIDLVTVKGLEEARACGDIVVQETVDRLPWISGAYLQATAGQLTGL